ncbi:RNA 2',3'-cyclic phosphodiesterase [Planotetraspora sp. A-T 1434]|uniref:RNA 2',3'-cyclic phosphodiesterase n=1 Tax=Planotetraspora sp. A-T 1434 TaxID=2979219 RepID=UPI0021BFD768|nr:RNA 2',3'-cyclic phosphodiesterase [Planotetraspora sp. A-T 1434]MCT9933289.1 RNA 2',3'-cyclic phosphodiesterase [Planotetraspora sp. A-T 1434]
MSRLFVALLPPPEALAEVAAAVDPVRARWPELRWIDPALWHVTLAFLGEVPDRVLPDLRVRLARAASRHEPATLAFTGAGAFPSAARGRLFWLGLSADPPLTSLAGSVAAGARRAGARRAGARPPTTETDRKRFHPHLTLARSLARSLDRSRNGDDLRPLVGTLSAFTGREWEARAVQLVRSHLGSQVRYESVEAYPLGSRD